MEGQIVQWIVTGLVALVSLFGGMVIRDLSASIKELRNAHDAQGKELRDADAATRKELSTLVLKDDFKEWRDEQRSLFQQMFGLMSELRDQVSKKADRVEVR